MYTASALARRICIRDTHSLRMTCGVCLPFSYLCPMSCRLAQRDQAQNPARSLVHHLSPTLLPGRTDVYYRPFSLNWGRAITNRLSAAKRGFGIHAFVLWTLTHEAQSDRYHERRATTPRGSGRPWPIFSSKQTSRQCDHYYRSRRRCRFRSCWSVLKLSFTENQVFRRPTHL